MQAVSVWAHAPFGLRRRTVQRRTKPRTPRQLPGCPGVEGGLVERSERPCLGCEACKPKLNLILSRGRSARVPVTLSTVAQVNFASFLSSLSVLDHLLSTGLSSSRTSLF